MKFSSMTSVLKSLTPSVFRKRKKPTKIKDPRLVTGTTYMATGETFRHSDSKEGVDSVATESTAPPFSRSNSSSDFTSDQKKVLSAKLEIMSKTGNKRGYNIPLEDIAKRASFENMPISDTGSDISEDDPERMELRQALRRSSDDVSLPVSQADMVLRNLDGDIRGLSLCSSHSGTASSIKSEVPSTDVGFEELKNDCPRPRIDREFSGFSLASEHFLADEAPQSPQSPSKRWDVFKAGIFISTPDRDRSSQKKTPPKAPSRYERRSNKADE